MVALKIIERADQGPTSVGGCFVKSVDFNAFEGRGHVTVTLKRRRAKEFPDFKAALEYWQTISTEVPVRPDGKPNRPLTAYSVEIVP